MKINILLIKFIFLLFVIFIFCDKNIFLEIEKKGGYIDGVIILFLKIIFEILKIIFKNMIWEDLEFNFLNYFYLYIGVGVVVGDIDKDGL